MRKCIISSPLATQSGYGHHAREFIKHTFKFKENEWDIKLVSMPWGHTPYSYPIPNNWAKNIVRLPLQEQPDIWVQITVPNEFQSVGKYNIGVTAGTEGDIAPTEWIECINRMQLIIVPSNFTKQVFLNTAEKNNLQITTTIKVVPEYFNNSTYSKNNKSAEILELSTIVQEQFCFLFVGHWLQGNVGEDRKNISGMIHTFFETFKNKTKQPALIIKTSGATYSIVDRHSIDRKIDQLRKMHPPGTRLPNIYVLHGDLTDNEMNALYNHPKIKSMISFTKAEGFGRPLLEFSTTGKPIIAPHYSGQSDFLKKEFMISLPGGLTEIHPSSRNQFLIEGAKWYTIDYAFAKKALKEVMKHYNKFLSLSRKHIKHSNENFSEEAVLPIYQALFNEIENNMGEIPIQQPLNLPTLNKMELPKLKTI